VRRYIFVFNNQPDALIIQIYSVIKLYMFRGNFFAHHREFSTVHSAVESFKQFMMTDSKQSQDGTAVLYWLCLEAVIKTFMKLTNAEYIVENSW